MSKRQEEKTHSKETKQSLETDSEMTQILELSNGEFKITMISTHQKMINM